MKKSEYVVALSVIIGALLVLASFAVVLGKFQLSDNQKKIHMQFESVVGIKENCPIKFAGAQVGRVSKIRVLPRNDQTPGTKGTYCVEVEGSIDPSLELGDDVTCSLKQDGLLGTKFVSLTPGSLQAPPLPPDKILMAQPEYDISDLVGPGRDLITELQPVAQKLLPITNRLDSITAQLDTNLPGLIKNLDATLLDGKELLGTINTPEGRERIERLLANLRVVSDNLKVVSSNAKALTLTLSEKPWRLIWGGKTNLAPTEEQVLKSDKPLPIDNAIEVRPATAAADNGSNSMPRR